MKAIADAKGQQIEVGDMVELAENHKGYYRVIKADNEIIHVVGELNEYDLWCKNVIVIEEN
jgi:hypothetical protein